MKKSMNILLLLTLTILSIAPAQSQDPQLLISFYRKTCPNVVSIVNTTIRKAVAAEPRMAASLIRLQFHDCFVQGCDASILLDNTATIKSEKDAFPNVNSARGFDVIEDAKLAVEKACPGVVSCADILAIAAREAILAVGGPPWDLRLGRRDSTTANVPAANAELPGPTDTLEDLATAFANKGLTLTDMVALSGGHTIGQARCKFFRNRIYSNGKDINPAFAATRKSTCLQTSGDDNLAPFDSVTPDLFDNSYYVNLVALSGLLQSDQILTSNRTTNAKVILYSNNSVAFRNDFAKAMFKMSLISPTLGTNGVIRKVCSAIPGA